MPKQEAIAAMQQYVHNAFSRSHKIEQDGNSFLVTSQKGKFVIVTFAKEEVKGPTEDVQKKLEERIADHKKKETATAFLFLRSIPDYKKRRNHGAFLKQSWDKDSNGHGDPRNVKKITPMERVVEILFDQGRDQYEYQSRITYYNPTTDAFESVRLRKPSQRFPIIKTYGYACDFNCPKKLYAPGEVIDHHICKTEKRCTQYAIGRDKRHVRITKMEPPLRMEIYQRGDILLANIKN